MSTNFNGTNMRAIPVADIPFDKDRRYLCLIATSDTSVVISGGQGFVVLAGTIWAPMPAPINDITLTGAGTLILG